MLGIGDTAPDFTLPAPVLDVPPSRADDRPHVEVVVTRDPDLERWVALVEVLMAVAL